MSAYVIGRMIIHNRNWMDEYFSKVPDLIETHKGKFVVRGGAPSFLEGDDPLPDAVFVIEFPDRKQAEKFWASEEFQPLIALRQSGSTLNAVLVDKLVD